MKVLVVSEVPTHPTIEGNRMCQLGYCNQLLELGHEVYFMAIKTYLVHSKQDYIETSCFWGDKFLYYIPPFWFKYTKWAVGFLRRRFFNWYLGVDDHSIPGLSRYINKINKQYHFDAIIVNYVWLSKTLSKVAIDRKALFTHDCFLHKKLRIKEKTYYMLSPSQESKGLMRCPTIFSVQENESILFRYLSPNSNIFTVFCSMKFHDQPLSNNKNILFFSGGNEYNVNGINWYIQEVLPIILRDDPGVKLIIGGSICKSNRLIKHDAISKIGIIEDPANFYFLGDISINPVYQGTGIKIKTIESISYGKATIVRSHSVEGLYESNKLPLFIADDPCEFANIIIKILNDAERLKMIKKESEIYIDKMNRHIQSQFSYFLN